MPGEAEESGRRILIVDDEEESVYAIKKTLKQYGYEIDYFSDPKKALSNFKTNAYSLLILDIRMPGISGFQFLRNIRQIDKEVKVLFLTTFEIQEKEWQMVLPNIQVQGFIKKPVNLQEIVEAVCNESCQKTC